ncbi:MAG: hypothetical protein WBP38_02380 [Hyphomicrobium sp.]|nr:hypothetical protein [Hyphomicrobium sp.]
MRLPSPPRIPVLSREDKEARLKVFIAEALAARAASVDGSFGEPFTLVARAPDSPAAQAVLAMANEIAAANVAVRVVLFETEPLTDDNAPASLLDVSAIDTRMLTDLRFASAHEQLVLGQGRVWIGDCMRRDPAKRDAFEMYHDNHASTASHAAASFAKLWDKSVSLTRMVATNVAADVILAGHAAPDNADITTRR